MTVYIYRWNRMDRKGQYCTVLCRGTMNSCLIEFGDGFRAVTSRNALRKAKPWEMQQPSSGPTPPGTQSGDAAG